MKKANKALHNIPAPDEDKMRFLYDSKTSKVQKPKSLEVQDSKTSKSQKPKSPKVKKSQSSRVLNSKSLEVKKLRSPKLKNSKTLKAESSKVQDFKSPNVLEIKTQAKYKTFKNLSVLFSNKDIDILAKFEREIMQNRDLKTERITKNSILRCLVKILPLIKFNKNKIPDENVLMDRILKTLEKKLNSQ